MNFFNLFNRKRKNVPPKRLKQSSAQRSFKGALTGRFTNWLLSTFTPINRELQSELRPLVIRCRDLAKNNEVFRSHLNNIEKSIIGQQGFRLQSLVKGNSNTLDESVNNELETAWWEFGKRSNGFITKDGQMGDKDFDCLILRTLIIDRRGFHPCR